VITCGGSDAFFVNINVNKNLINELISFSSDGKNISIYDLVLFKRKRLNDCVKENKNFYYRFKQDFLGTGEMALLLSVVGQKNFAIPISTVQTFLEHCRVPVNYKPYRNTNHFIVVYIMIKIKFINTWVGFKNQVNKLIKN